MSTYSYTIIRDDGSEVDEKEFSHRRGRRSLIVMWKCIFIAMATLLIVSLSTNALLLYQRFHKSWELCNDLPSRYAGLRRDVPRDIVPPEEYASKNRTVQNAAWDQPNMVTWELFVALDEDYAISHGLPHSQRWPWDASKGVYIPVAAHELHCVQVIRSFVNDKQDDVAESEMEWGYTHAIHCLNILRESVMCNADDQPMYTGRVNANAHFKEPEAGRGTTKMCRNWDSLVEWSRSHSACYLSVNRDDPDFSELDRYKFCPDGSRPWENS